MADGKLNLKNLATIQNIRKTKKSQFYRGKKYEILKPKAMCP